MFVTSPRKIEIIKYNALQSKFILNTCVKMNKRGIELSANVIVILIISIVVLSLVLMFVKTMFSKVNTDLNELSSREREPQKASSDEPLTLSRNTIKMKTGETTVLKFSVFNAGPNDYLTDDSGNVNQASILDTDKGCFTSGTTDSTHPLKIESQSEKRVKKGEVVNSMVLIKAHSSPVSTVCQVCTVEIGRLFSSSDLSMTVGPETNSIACLDLQLIIE